MIIGNNTLLETAVPFNLTSPKKLSGTTQAAVLLSNQRLIAVLVAWGGNGGFPTASGTIEVCLYDEGNVSADKPKIAGTTFQIPYNNTGLSGTQWLSVTGLNVDLSSHAGKTLCPGLAPPTGDGFSILLGTVTGAVRSNSGAGASTSTPDPFSSDGSPSSNQAFSVYFLTETIAAATSIDTIGSSGTVRVAATENITTTGLGTLTTASVGGKAAASIAATGGDGTITLAAFVDGVVYPAMGSGVSAVVGDGTNTATKSDAVLTTMSGWQYVNVSSLSTTEFSLGSAFSGGDLPTQLHVINDGTGVLNANGTLTNWAVGTYTCWARMAAGTWSVGTMKSFTFTVHEPIDTAGSHLTVSTDFTSPVVSQSFTTTPDDWSIVSVLSSPDLSQSSIIEPADVVITTEFSQPAITTSGVMIVDDWTLATLLVDPSLTQAHSITVNDLTVGTLLSIPSFSGDQPTVIYGNRIILICR